MKHQLFKKGVYVEIDTGQDHLTVIGKVSNSEIITTAQKDNTFNFPQESIELEHKLLIIHEDPETTPQFIDDIIFISEVIQEFDGIKVELGKLLVAIFDIEVPATELKEMFYKCNQGAK